MTQPLSEQRRQSLNAAETRARLFNPPNAFDKRRLEQALELAKDELRIAQKSLAEAEGKIAAKDRRIERLLKSVADQKEELETARALISTMESIKRLIAKDEKPVDLIIQEVLDQFPSVGWDDVISLRRGGKEVVRCRQECMHAVKKQTLLSYPEIAKIFNRTDHTTIMSAVKKIEAEKAAGGANE